VEPAYRFVSSEAAPVVRDIMLAAFEEYRAMLTVPSSAFDETIEDVAAHIAAGGAVLAEVDGAVVASGRFEWRTDHVYIGRLSVLPAFRNRGLASGMMIAIEGCSRERGISEARISVRTMLPKNISLYERLGYIVTARYKHERGDEFVVDMTKRF
jgi:ribosomal protein S18 acetylase RimI-like enzyme